MKVHSMARIMLVGAGLLTVANLAGTQQESAPRIANAQLETRAAGASFERDFRARVAEQPAPVWYGYAAPIVAGTFYSCCSGDGCCGACGLEARSQFSFQGSEPRGVKLEGATQMYVLFRVENRAVGRIRTFTEDCPLDAGGLPFVWFTGVTPAQSVALLASFAEAAERNTAQPVRRLGSAALDGIARHAGPEADTALERFSAAGRSDWLREKSVFWLGAARGERGYATLRRIAREDPSDRIREKAVHALSVSKVPAALDTIMEIARTDRSTRVRGQALFWLAQKAGQQAVAAITSAIENDPETDVKKRAVFALSQLPADEGVPLLIQVARTNRNPEVRKQAMHWLGQSRDPRALRFFEEVLKQ